jgi:hypothetical protein
LPYRAFSRALISPAKAYATVDDLSWTLAIHAA